MLVLHIFSSLDTVFSKKYINNLNHAHETILFFCLETLIIKNRIPINLLNVKRAFNYNSLNVITDFIYFKSFV